MRLVMLLCAVLLCLGAAPALAQDPAPDPEDTEFLEPEAESPDDEVIDEVVEDEVVDDGEEPYETPACEGAEAGTDTDYTYCGCSADDVGTEGDYVYCAASPGGGVERRKGTDRDAGGEDAVHEVRSLPASLPLTGGQPLVIALIGAGFVLIGTGGRLRLRHRR